MNIKHLRSRRFAGLKDIDLEFAPGLNVVLGPNEAGKSTMMEAVRLGMISRVALKGTEKEEFERRYLPREGGDTIDVELLIGTAQGDLRLSKSFGARPSIQLEAGPGPIITRETVAYQQLNTVLGCGERTIDTLVFARQGDFNRLFDQVTSQELAPSLNRMLQAVLLEMDGISVQTLKNSLNEAIEQLLGHWDWEKGSPEGGRTVDRPFQRGVGKVLASYYQREKLGKAMKQLLDTEQRLAAASRQITQSQAAIKQQQQILDQFESLESDTIKRLELEPSLQELTIRMGKTSNDIDEWPRAEHSLERKQEKLVEVVTRLSLLKVEEEHSRKRETRRNLSEVKSQVEKCNEQIEWLNQELTGLIIISETEMTDIENLNRRLEDIKLSLRASQMQISLTLAAGQTGTITCDFDEEPMTGENSYEASGFLRLVIDGVAVIEVKSGESDYNQLKAQYDECHNLMGGILLAKGVDSIEDIRYSYRRAASIHREVDGLQVMAALLLGARTLEDITSELSGLNDLPPARPLPEIKQELEALWSQEVILRQEIDSLNTGLDVLQASYGSRDEATAMLADLQNELQTIQKEVDRLQPLPEGFAGASSFRAHLNQCRDDLKLLGQEYADWLAVYRETEAVLAASAGLEELIHQYDIANTELQRLLSQAEVMLRIKDVWSRTQEEIESEAEKPLIHDFALQVAELTGGRYGVVGASGFLEFHLLYQDEYNMPLDLLSAGTIDLIALAFRFTLLDRVFPHGGGMVVLDDCLVDLDPKRRQKAIALIKRWAQAHQVIFITCDPSTADLLGGNIISVG